MSSSLKNETESLRGPTEGVMVRISFDLMERLDIWIKHQKGKPLTRPEAIRRLIGRSLRNVKV